MGSPIAPLQSADMPARTLPFWKMTGPGAVLVGLSIGAGEIVVWPRIAAEYGASMVWAAVLGIFLQFWINLEIGRWTIATGESAYTGLSRVWRGFAVAFIFFNFFGWFFPGWARVSGSALKALTLGPNHPSPDWLWTAITFAGVALLIFGPKRIYAVIERSIGAMVVLITVGLLIIAVKLGTWENVKQMGAGIVNVGYRDPGFSVKELFIAMVFAGAGGTANLFYSFYLRDKRIGMGARMPMLLNAFRKQNQTAAQSGYLFQPTPENTRRFKDWFKYVVLDQTLYFWLLNTFTLLLFIFAALVALRPAGIVPSSGSLIWDEAHILEKNMGLFGRYLFLVIGVATLFSTQITLVDGVSRSMADLFHGSFTACRRISEPSWYATWAIFMIVFGVVITFILEHHKITDLGFLFNAAYVGGFAMAIYAPVLLLINLTRLPPGARPRLLNIVMVSFASLVYIGFAAYCLVY